MLDNKRIPDDLYALVYGQYVPRLTVDIIVIGPEDTFTVTVSPQVDLLFDVQGPNGIVLIQRDILPEIYSWHIPGGTIRRGETLEIAAKRIMASEAGIEIDILNIIGSMEFLHEEREVDIDEKKEQIDMHTISVVFLAKAKSNTLKGSKDGKNVGWFKTIPSIGHTVHIPFLMKHGFLKNSI